VTVVQFDLPASSYGGQLPRALTRQLQGELASASDLPIHGLSMDAPMAIRAFDQHHSTGESPDKRRMVSFTRSPAAISTCSDSRHRGAQFRQAGLPARNVAMILRPPRSDLAGSKPGGQDIYLERQDLGSSGRGQGRVHYRI